MNRSSTHLTSDPTRVMFLTGQQPDSTAAALNKFCSICTPNGVYTEFGIDPTKQGQGRPTRIYAKNFILPTEPGQLYCLHLIFLLVLPLFLRHF